MSELNVDAETIRRRTTERLHDLGLSLPASIPLPDERYEMRSARDVATRIVALYALAGLANGADADALREWLQETRVYDTLLPSERAKFQWALTERDLAEVSWRQESLYTLCWLSNVVKLLPPPTNTCDLAAVFPRIPPEVEMQEFLPGLTLREPLAAVAEADLHYCLHWIVKHERRFFGRRQVRRLNADVIIERRHALEWVTTAGDWDDVALDT